MEISMACKLALKSIENEIKILNLIIDDKNDRIKELEQQLEQERFLQLEYFLNIYHKKQIY